MGLFYRIKKHIQAVKAINQFKKEIDIGVYDMKTRLDLLSWKLDNVYRRQILIEKVPQPKEHKNT